MSRKLVSLLLCLALCLCALPVLAEDGVTVTDMKGREITLDAPAARIVALSPSDCEILYALGAEDTLVGRGQYCDYPEAVLEKPAGAVRRGHKPGADHRPGTAGCDHEHDGADAGAD